jgi:hypothetical protein
VTAPEVVPCGHCGRPLTDPDSRALGYGPVCAAGVLGYDTHRTPVPRGPRRRKNVNQIPLPLEAPMPEKFEITMTYERTLTFNVEADSAFDAYSHAASAFMYDDLHPDDEGVSELELQTVKVGEREIRISSHFDFTAPKVRGLAPRKYIAYEGSERLGENPDLQALLDAHFAAS